MNKRTAVLAFGMFVAPSIFLILLRIMPLNFAIGMGLTPIAKLQLAMGSDVNAAFDGRHPLQEACIAQKADLVELLVSHGADVNRKSAYSTTALMSASARGCVRCVEILLEAGVNLDDADDVGTTALIFAVMNDKFIAAEALLRGGSNPNIAMKNGTTPLMVAIKHESVSTVQLLVSNGASINAVSQEHKTAADFAASIVDISKRTAILEQLAAAQK